MGINGRIIVWNLQCSCVSSHDGTPTNIAVKTKRIQINFTHIDSNTMDIEYECINASTKEFFNQKPINVPNVI